MSLEIQTSDVLAGIAILVSVFTFYFSVLRRVARVTLYLVNVEYGSREEAHLFEFLIANSGTEEVFLQEVEVLKGECTKSLAHGTEPFFGDPPSAAVIEPGKLHKLPVKIDKKANASAFEEFQERLFVSFLMRSAKGGKRYLFDVSDAYEDPAPSGLWAGRKINVSKRLD